MPSCRRALATLVSLALVLVVGVGQGPASAAETVVTGYELRLQSAEGLWVDVTEVGPTGSRVRYDHVVGVDVVPKLVAAVPGTYTLTFNGPARTQSVSFTVVDGQVTPVEAVLEADVSVRGRLVHDDGSPATELLQIAGTSARSESDGSFVFIGLEPGSHALTLSQWGRVIATDVVVVDDSTTTLPDIVVPKWVELRARITSPAGVTVSPYLYSVVDGVTALKPVPGAFVGGQAGEYWFKVQEPGVYELRAFVYKDTLAPVRRTVTLGRGVTNVAVTVSAGSPITGIVRDADLRPWDSAQSPWTGTVQADEVSCSTGAPVPSGLAHWVQMQVRADGTFSLPAVPGACYDLRGSTAGYLSYPIKRRVAAGTRDLAFVPRELVTTMSLSPSSITYGTPTTLRVAVTKPGLPGKPRRPVSGGTVTISEGTKVLGRATVSAQGVAQLPMPTLAPGRHDLEAQFSGTSTTAGSSMGHIYQVAKAYPKITVTATNVRLGYGATVVAVISGPCAATGTVTIQHNWRSVGSVAVQRVRGGYAAILTTSRLRTPGNIGLVYTGNSCMHGADMLTQYYVN